MFSESDLFKEKNDKDFQAQTSTASVSRQFYKLFILSTFTFVIASLLIRCLAILYSAILLRYYSINFTYSLFAIQFSSVSQWKWTIMKIFVIHGLGPICLFLAGLSLLRFKAHNWKFRLTLTWIEFMMINLLPLSLLAGIFFYEDFGIAYSWLVQNIYIRFALAIIAIALAAFWHPFWVFKFLKTAGSKSFLKDEKTIFRFIRFCFIYPWLAGTIILLIFASETGITSWAIIIVGMGLIVLPLFRKDIPPLNIRIYKPDNNNFTMIRYLPIFIIILVAIWFLSRIRVPF
jgi:hypothetical protein